MAPETSPQPSAGRDPRSATSWRARLALVGVGVGLLVILELVLRLLPLGTAAPATGFAGSPPLFIRESTAAAARWVIAPEWRRSFNPQSFAVDAGSDRVLVFCVGGSSVYGYPYGAVVAFPAQLQALLRRAYPGRDIEVVNVGGMSYGSERLALLVPQLVRFHPRAIVLYTGHNEFIEQGLAARLAAPAWETAVRRVAGRLALYRALATLLAPRAAEPAGESGAGAFGIDVERREGRFATAAERRRVEERFAGNLQRMVDCALAHGVTPVLVTVGANIGDWRPEAGTLDPALPPDGVLRFALAAARGQALERAGDAADALAAYRGALDIDASHAVISYRAGRVARGLGRMDEARALLERALVTDAAPIRALPELNDAVRALAARRRVPLVDAAARFAAASPDGIPGAGLFWDYCHPDVAGHRLIAEALQPVLADLVGLGPSPADAAAVAPPRPPESAFGAWWLGNVALRQGRPAEAIPLCERAHQLAPAEFRPLACLGMARQALGDAAGALASFQQAAAAAPRSVLAHNQLGGQLARLGRWDDALAEFEAARRLDPEARGVDMNIGGVELARRHLAAAEAAFAREEQRSPHLTNLHRNLGLAALVRGDPAAAAADFLAELRINPGDAVSAARLAQALAATGRPAEAGLAAQVARALGRGGVPAQWPAARPRDGTARR